MIVLPASTFGDHTIAGWRSRPGLLATIRDTEPRLFDLGVLLLLLMLPTGFAALVDARLLQGVGIWDKPLKFEFALGVYLLTLAVFARFLPAGMTQTRWYRLYAGSVIAAVVLEMIWIGAAAALGTSSHFNTTPLGSAVYMLMGAFAVLLTSMTAVYALQIGRNSGTGLSPAVKEAVVIGLGLVLPLTLITAGTMSSMEAHGIGGGATDAGGLALIGWARDGGDLRVAHFFATHAMHFVPAFGLASAALLGPQRVFPVRFFAVVFVLLVGFTYVQALMGQPFLPALG